MRKLLPYLLLLAGMIGMAVYPRLLSPAAPPALHSDGFVGFVHGLCIGLDVLAVMMVTSRLRTRTARS